MRILLFIVLKILEILVLVFLPYIVGSIATKRWGRPNWIPNPKLDVWLGGMTLTLIGILSLVLLYLLLCLLPSFFDFNWQLVDKIIQ